MVLAATCDQLNGTKLDQSRCFVHVLVFRVCLADFQSDERLASVRLESLVQLMVIHAQAGEDSEEVIDRELIDGWVILILIIWHSRWW